MLLPTQSDPATGSASGFASAMNANLGAFRSNDQNIENRLESLANSLFGTGVIAGSYSAPLLSVGSGLSVVVEAHQSLIGVVVNQSASASIAVPDNAATAYLWEFQDGSHSATTTAANPGTTNNPAVKLGTCVTSSGAVTSVSDTRTEVNPLTTGGLTPVGGIILWSGTVASIPSGWHLCDGTSGTPDLRSRFIVGAGSDYAPGATGGSTTTSGSVSGATNAGNAAIADHPSHYHSISAGHTSGYTGAPNSTLSTSVAAGSDIALDLAKADHIHGAVLDAGSTDEIPAMSHTDSGHTHPFTGTTSSMSILPPYYALAYIMRIA
jgi:hypothetical protein